ncbi:MAG: PAS domain S-box protein, partial [Candidatus Thorarchaeota archaeon]
MTMKILIVDDDKDLLVLIQRFLMKEYSEIEVISAVSAQDALRRLEIEQFDAVVCDFYLGKNEMTGLELLEWLRIIDLDMPFIMFTGRSREEVAIKALNLGANFYLKKDVEDFENLFRELVHHITAAVETRHIEDALADSEARFRAMFELAPIGVARVSTDGKLLEVNTSLSQMLGYSMNELVGMDVYELTTSEDAELERRLSEELLQGLRDSFQMEKRFIRKDGELIWGRLSVSVVLNTRGEPVFTIGMVEDVTELKRERESLRESEAKFRAIFEEAGIGITIAVEDHIVDVNPAYAKLLGYSRDELSGMNIRAFSNQEDHEIDRKLYFETIERGHNTYDMRKRYIHKDGTPIWVDLTVSVVRSEEGSPEFIFGMVQDVTEQVKMVDTIKENEQKFRELFDMSPIAIELFDPDGNVQDANNAALITFGLDSIEDFLGFNLFKDPNLPDGIKEEMQKGNTTRFEIEFDFEWVAKHQMYVSSKTGKKHLDMLSTPLLSADGSTITGYLSQIQDISTRNIIEKQLVERTKELELIFNSVPAGIWYKDTENNIIFVNKAGAKSVGLTPEDLNGKSSYDVFPEFAEKYYQDDLEVINSETPKLGIIERLVTITGERLWVQTDKVPLFNSEGTVDGVLVISTGITDLKETQDALKNSGEIYRSMIELSPDVIVSVDLDGVVISCSKAIEQLTGYSPETMIGQNYKDMPFMTQDELPQFSDVFAQILLEKKVIIIDTEFIHKDGTQRRAEVRIGLISVDGEVRGAQAIAIDITERKLADDALRESEERYRSIFDNTLAGVVRVGLEDGKVLFCNDSAACILGFDTVDEVIENYITIEHFVDPDFRERTLQRAPETGGKLEYQTEMTKRNGETFWIQASTTINEEEDYADTVFLDVTERKQADAALRKSEERYRTLVEQIHDGYVVLQDGKVAFANQIIADTFGYTLNEFIGIPFTELVAPEDIDMITERYHRRLAEAPLKEKNDVRAVRKDGTRFIALLSDSPLEFNGKPATLTTVIDVTERRKLEQETQYLANLIENVSDAIISTDLEFKVRSWNKAAEEVYGWKVEEVIGKSLVDLLHSETISITIDDSEKELVTTGRWDGEAKQKTKDGRRIYVQSSVSLLRDKDGNPYGAVAINTDITERVGIEEALRESDARNRMIVNSMSDLVLIYDSEGRYSNYFAKDDSLLIRPWNELQGRKLEEIVPPDLVAEYHEYEKKVRDDGESITYEHEIEIGNTLRWLQATMMLHEDKEHIVVAVKDITTQKEAEESLKMSEAENRNLIENIQNGILIVQDGVIVFANKVLAQMLGYEITEIVGIQIPGLFLPEDREWVVDRYHQRIAGKSVPSDY